MDDSFDGQKKKSWIERQKDKALPQSMADFKDECMDPASRDPKNLHSEVLISFEDIIAEPTGYHSSKYTWNMAKEIYGWGKTHAYELFSFLFGIPMSFLWGCLYAVVACLHVWCYAPLARSQNIKAGCWRNCWGICIATCMDPVFESAGKVFNAVDIHTEKIIVE